MEWAQSKCNRQAGSEVKPKRQKVAAVVKSGNWYDLYPPAHGMVVRSVFSILHGQKLESALW